MQTDTAHAAWNVQWASADGRARWAVADESVVRAADALRGKHGRVRALDVGCGVGRHALYLAGLGFETFAVDMAEEGLEQVRLAAGQQGLKIESKAAPMTALPFPDRSFDYVLSFNVIYHGDEQVVRQALREIARVLEPGGIFQGTMLSKRNVGYGLGREVSRNTFVRDPGPDAGDDSDKNHPHYYCNAAELVGLLDGYELLSLEDCEQRRPGHWHWQFVAERHK